VGRAPELASGERGVSRVRRRPPFLDQFLSAWDEYGVVVEELIDAGDQVVAVMRLNGRTNELEVDEARSPLLTLRDGSCGSSPLRARMKPSKPPGCGSKRCRRRTPRSSSAASRAWNRKDIPGFLRAADPEIRFEHWLADLERDFTGVHAVRAWHEDLARHFDHWRVDCDDFRRPPWGERFLHV
jgi:hypothetical protein